MSIPPPPLAIRFAATLEEDAVMRSGERILVALSGGLDSTVLLHLLRHTPGLPSMELRAAHLDHRMRPGSRPDARWVMGLARAWEVPLLRRAVRRVPANETEARAARYRFLEEARRRTRSHRVLTAHHADDQAETVAYRMLRGTGLAGLAGIPRTREGGIYRPLLSFWKQELADYATACGLRYRTDPTNRDNRVPRNVLRHQLLPLAEARVAPGARRALNRLADLAGEEKRLWNALLPLLLDRIRARSAGGCTTFSRDALLRFDPLVRSRILRTLAVQAGARLDRSHTRLAVDFASSARSGRSLDLPGGVVLSRSFAHLAIARAREEIGGRDGKPETCVVEIPAPGEGVETGCAGGAVFTARWSTRCSVGGAELALDGLRFPVFFRDWQPGDRISLSIGTRKLKKLFAEKRIPRAVRGRRPVVVDAKGRVLWVPGLARSIDAVPEPGEAAFHLGVELNEELVC